MKIITILLNFKHLFKLYLKDRYTKYIHLSQYNRNGSWLISYEEKIYTFTFIFIFIYIFKKRFFSAVYKDLEIKTDVETFDIIRFKFY